MTSKIYRHLSAAWNQPNGYKDICRIGLPLIISMSSHTAMLFTDRLFLGRYALDAIAAAVPAGLLAFMFACFFMGVVEFTNVFVAQYIGAEKPRKVGCALWQGIYFALGAGLLLAGLSFGGETIFRWTGHAPQVRTLEAVYFRILMQGAVFGLLQTALSCFYSGRGMTIPIMVINIIGVTLNIPLDYILINGALGLPELGIAGSAIATVISHATMALLFILMVFSARNHRLYGLENIGRFDWGLFKRLLKFGTPAGIHFFIDIFGFSIFVIMVGRLGRNELAATNIACSINTLAFMPMIGFSIAVSTLMGQAIGRNRPEDGMTATRSALHITCVYMWTLAALFLIIPEIFINIFRTAGESAEQFGQVRHLAIVILRFVAFFCVFDTLNVIYSGALRGAGDTKFIGWTIAALSSGLLIAPTVAGTVWLNASLYTLWGFVSAYVCILAMVFRWRYRSGKWKNLRLLDSTPAMPSVFKPDAET